MIILFSLCFIRNILKFCPSQGGGGGDISITGKVKFGTHSAVRGQGAVEMKLVADCPGCRVSVMTPVYLTQVSPGTVPMTYQNGRLKQLGLMNASEQAVHRASR